MLLLIDIGATNTRLATSIDAQTISDPIIFKTPDIFHAALKQIVQHLKILTSHHIIEATIVGIPGVLDQAGQTLRNSPNLQPWINEPITKELEIITNGRVYLVNDSDLAGLGESNFGAGKDYDIIAYLTISTGIGGTRIVDKQIDRHALGFEPGHQIIDVSGQLCPECPKPTSLEHLIGGAHIEQRYHQKPEDIDDPNVWIKLAEYLAIGLNNVIVFWSPDVIILGGPMMNDIPIDHVKSHLKKNLQVIPVAPAVFPAALGQSKALYGGLAYFNQLSSSHPKSGPYK